MTLVPKKKDAFITVGYTNWNHDAVEKSGGFSTHERSEICSKLLHSYLFYVATDFFLWPHSGTLSFTIHLLWFLGTQAFSRGHAEESEGCMLSAEHAQQKSINRLYVLNAMRSLNLVPLLCTATCAHASMTQTRLSNAMVVHSQTPYWFPGPCQSIEWVCIYQWW